MTLRVTRGRDFVRPGELFDVAVSSIRPKNVDRNLVLRKHRLSTALADEINLNSFMILTLFSSVAIHMSLQ